MYRIQCTGLEPGHSVWQPSFFYHRATLVLATASRTDHMQALCRGSNHTSMCYKEFRKITISTRHHIIQIVERLDCWMILVHYVKFSHNFFIVTGDDINEMHIMPWKCFVDTSLPCRIMSNGIVSTSILHKCDDDLCYKSCHASVPVVVSPRVFFIKDSRKATFPAFAVTVLRIPWHAGSWIARSLSHVPLVLLHNANIKLWLFPRFPCLCYDFSLCQYYSTCREMTGCAHVYSCAYMVHWVLPKVRPAVSWPSVF